jgi:polyisoprenoid-binding protein YceI
MKPVNGLLLIPLLYAVSTPASDWSSRAADSSLAFTARLEGAAAPGRFHRFDVLLRAGVSGPAGGSLLVEIDTTSADLFSHDINEAIADPEWFDFNAFPSARFESDAITLMGESIYEARGTLQLKGVSRPVVVSFQWQTEGASGHMKGDFVLRRGDFSIGSGDWAGDDTISEAVEVSFDVALDRIH